MHSVMEAGARNLTVPSLVC